MSRLGEILFEEGLIEPSQLTAALEEQKTDKRKLGRVLVDKGWVSEDKLTEVLARIFQLPYIRLSNTIVDKKVLGIVSYELMQNYKVFPISFKNDNLIVATNDPLDVAALQEVQYKSGYPVNPVMASLHDIEEYLRGYSDSLHTINAMKAVSDKSYEGTPVQQLVDSFINTAIKEKASDIHFEPLKDRMRVRFRIDGVLYERNPIPKELERNVISRIKIISGMDVAENRRPQDGRSSVVKDNQEYDLRISTLPDILGESLVLRILNKNFMSRSFESLGMDASETKIMKRLMHRPYGLVLVTGPTGSGKTTTLYSILTQLNQVAKNIVSVEDPVEYILEGINQTAINKLMGYTFATAMRHILRHDPDIIMIGEIRDAETAEIAIQAALTGHLVFSTVHTNTAAGAITRLLEMNIEPFLISSAMNGVIAQRLVRKLCPNCKTEYMPTDEIFQNIKRIIPLSTPPKLAQRVGCDQCLQTGYAGRTGIFEILECDDDIRKLILKSASEEDILQKALPKGMKNLRMAGFQNVVKKITTLEEVIRTTFID